MAKSKKVVYKSYHFSSSLEARWAVFFDALGIPWEYKKEGRDLGETGGYQPDFWLPQQEIYIDVRPATYNDKGEIEFPENARERALEKKTGIPVVTLCGIPGKVTHPFPPPFGDYVGFRLNDSCYYWCECPFCGAVGIQFEARSARNKHEGGCRIPLTEHPDKVYSYDTESLNDAYIKARLERFENKY